jgi:imidazolonepropionase
MPTTLIHNIKSLVQVYHETPSAVKGEALKKLPQLNNAWLLFEYDRIKDFGPMASCPENADNYVDAEGGMVFPSWCDSHTHLVFAASREGEFVDKINGLTYAEIAAKGGGIINSARRLGEMSEQELFEGAMVRLKEIAGYGTGAVEIKSGYGLSYEGELKMLRVIKRLKASSPLTIKATFLGAHALPQQYKENREAYLKLLIEDILPVIAEEALADYIDAFCEKGFFTPEETARIIEAGAKFGLKAKIHTNQFNSMGGIEASVNGGALSVDHLEVINDEEIACLAESKTMPVMLPSAPFFLNDPYPPARKLINAGLPVVLATDYNPGSSPSGKMPFVLSLACVKMKMLPEEAINAATINGAYAMELEADHGSIKRGNVANCFITKPIPSAAYIPYAFGSDVVAKAFVKGIEI